MSRLDRLKEYAAERGPKGASRDQANLDHWERRASENSKIAPRATNKSMELPSTGEVKLRPTSMAPSRKGDARAEAKSDLNFVGSGSFMPKVRRGES
jgi:hypothetical protein